MMQDQWRAAGVGAAAGHTDTLWSGHGAAFDAARGLLRSKAAELQQRHTSLSGQQAALAEKHGGAKVSGSDRLKLNVGGTRVAVRREVMTQFPGTLLEALFSGRWEDALLRDKTGRIFLDVSPPCFKKIVDFLNLMKIADPTDPPELPDTAPEDREAFARLCDFFGLTAALTPPPVPALLRDSSILEECSHVDALHGWLEGTEHHCELLYRASADGWTAAQFHAKCDDKGPTLTLIKSTGGHIFGGYADKPWSSQGGYHSASPEAFLFALSCHSGLGPTKMPLTVPAKAMAHSSNHGPTFGSNVDLHVANNANSNTESTIFIGGSYQCPAGQNAQTFITGSHTFQAAEVEVFAVTG